ncbi:carbohydrate ABC transporter permease [Agromyces silvae]|uniref:carbohydrate ABC transporter permease n=1 Tax=Agromyces silvae TaxID=3388266 RepID=UPI00280A9A7F|nr:sugar ABC transporter permease [Agromyces protaetiae]
MTIPTHAAAERSAAAVPARKKVRPAADRASEPKKARLRRDLLIGALFLLPGVLLAVGFKLIPLAGGVSLSLQRTQGFAEPEFAGLANYERMLSDPVVLEAFRNAIVVTLTLPVWVLLPLVLAVLIHQRTPGWRFFRAAYFLPYTIAPIVVGIMFRQILAPDGPLNEILRGMGLGALAIEWLNGPVSALFSLVGVALWCFFGYGVLTYLAGLSTVPAETIEAARIDGAGFWRLLFQIILPLIRGVVGYWTVLCASGVLIWMFPLIYALTKGGPGNATMLPEFLVFLTTFQFLDRGYGSAIGIVLFLFVGLISIFAVRFMYREGKSA